MKNKHFLNIPDFSYDEIHHILTLAKKVKKNKKAFQNKLRRRTLGVLFEKPSTRTRISFEAGIAQLGGISYYLNEIKLDGVREEVKDVARVLSSYLDSVVMRTFKHQTIVDFAKYSKIPIINGLSDLYHPCQAMSDLFTIHEVFGEKKGLTLAYVGDGNNVLHSLMHLLPLFGVSLRVATPKDFPPQKEVLEYVRTHPRKKAEVFLTQDPKEAVKGADMVYTDVWVSMGEEGKADAKTKHFKEFQINENLLKLAKPGARVMHCLPCHRGMEITDGAVEGSQSIVFLQAENRLHVQKAILLYLLA
jgi:ornithine carbamoyltransferase